MFESLLIVIAGVFFLAGFVKGVIGLGLGEAVVASLPQSPPALVTALVQSVIPFLTAGYLLTERA